MNAIEEFKHRIKSVREGKNQGYGDKQSLRYFTESALRRIKDLEPVANAAKKSLVNDEVAKELIEEYESLITLCDEAQSVLDDVSIPGVDVRSPK